jgi:proteasome lid subunit RPN8/RPN11
MRRIRDAKQTMMGIYHSHPRTTAYPSLSDVEMAFYPEAVYFIISLEPRVDLRAFEIDRRRIQEVEISVLPAY